MTGVSTPPPHPLPPPWRLTRRIELFKPRRRGESVFIYGPTVGRSLIAFAVHRDLRLLLDRRGFEPRWEGCVKHVNPVRWHEDLLHLEDERGRLQVWDVCPPRMRWEADAELGHEPWAGRLVVLPTSERFEIRQPDDGRVASTFEPNVGRLDGFRVVGDLCIGRTVDRRLVALGLPTGAPVWELSLATVFGSVPAGDAGPIGMLEGDGTLLVLWGPAWAMIDVVVGSVLWVRPRTLREAIPLISHERVFTYLRGRLHLLHERTGQTIAEATGVAPSVGEWTPVVSGEQVVVVDQKGFILTFELTDGTVLGAQFEKKTGYAGCAVIDDRLAVNGTDGAVWIYERSNS
jgi:hypothetical protein